MPLTAFQREVARLLAANRNPDSMVGGGAVMNRAADSLRYSEDLDVFHDPAASVAASAELDAAVLAASGHQVDWVVRREDFQRADVVKGDERVRLDWVADTAFRFFPAQKDAS